MTKKQVLFQQVVSAVLFIAVLVMVGWLSNRYKVEADWTAGNRNTLTEASQKQLDSMPDPIRFMVFMYPRSEVRQAVEADFRRYQRVKDNIVVEFIDPSTNPQKVRDYNVSHAGQVVVEYQGRRESLTATTEPAITTALQRLAYAGERWVVFLAGHGEPGIDEQDELGYGGYAQLLRDKGLKVRSLNLATDPRIPDNTAVLVVASPGKPLLEGEARIVTEYVEKGGNLLWLADPEVKPGLEPLAKLLGLTWLEGTGIMLESAALGLPPYVYITTEYPSNPVTKDFHENVLFPLVRGLRFSSGSDAGGWQAKALLQTSDQAWLETGNLEGGIEPNVDKGDTMGPLTIGATFTRDAKVKVGEGDAAVEETHPQRVVVIGDSEFLSNSYLGQLGNGLLGLNLAQWLASRDAQLNIDVPKAPDTALVIPELGLWAIYIGFAFLLPAGLLGFGVVRWVVRRRR